MITPTRQEDRCHFCGTPMRSLKDDFLVLNVYGADGPAWFLAHELCLDSNWKGQDYTVVLQRIVEHGTEHDPPGADTLVSWLAHCRGKVWFSTAIEEALEVAHTEAVRLSRGSDRS